MKNCLIVEGGDDMITTTIKGCLPSGNNKLYMFSDETKAQWSNKLKTKYAEYEKIISSYEEQSSEILKTQYNILDLILYLQSGRMPTLETDEKELHSETEYIITQYKKHFPQGLAISEDTLDEVKKDTVVSRNGTIRQIFALFVDEGYAVKYENGNYNPETYVWTGNIIIYQLQDRETCATITVREDGSTIKYSDIEDTVESDMTIHFHVGDEYYETFIKQKIAIATENYEYIEDQGYNNPKEWQKYCLNRLVSYEAGYNACLETLEELKNDTELENVRSLADDFIISYNQRLTEIRDYMNMLETFLHYLYEYYGDYETAPSQQDVDYQGYHDDSLRYKDTHTSFINMVSYIRYGVEWGESTGNGSTDHPLYCSLCNSKSVTLDGCNNCDGRAMDIVTYGTLANDVLNAYNKNSKTLSNQKDEIYKYCNLYNHLTVQDENGNILDDTLYKEFFSYIREDIYTNSNFVSDGLGNTEIINNTKELIQKAKQELAKVCVSQHTLSGDVHSFVAYSELNKDDFPIEGVYDKFILGNFMRYQCDDKMYKLRLSSEEFSWNDNGCELNVEFTDVVRYLGGGISDIASLVQAVGSLATTANTAKTQAEKGVETSKEFQKIKDEGLQSALSNVLAARNIDVQIDETGILLRKYDYDLDDYSPFQMKLINRNLVMTTDNWKTSSLAIGHMRYNGNELYGVVANAIIGDLMITKELQVMNESGSVIIDENGITLDGGTITWKKKLPSSSVDGLDDYLTQLDGRIQTFSQTTDPSLDWTDDEKVNHTGDIWLNPNDGLTKQWTGTEWDEITDSELKSLAESKAQIFTTTPTTPYYKGDLWVQGKDGDIYHCTTTKLSGNCESGHWILSSKYTDDTKALEALEKAQQGIKDAASALTNAQKYADEKDTALSTNLKSGYEKYADSKVKTLDDAVADYLGLPGSTVTQGSDYIVSPYIGGGYLNIASGKKRVIIDPKNKGNTGYIFQVHNDTEMSVGIDKDGNATFNGTVYATNGKFSGSIDCGNGNFTVNENGKLNASGGITFKNDLVSWNGTSCFQNSQNVFQIQQGDENGENPVVKVKIDEDETYIAGDNTRIIGSDISIGTFQDTDTETVIQPRIKIPDGDTDNGIYIYKDGSQFMNLTSAELVNPTTYLTNLKHFRIEKYGCMVTVFGVWNTTGSNISDGNIWLATFPESIRPKDHTVYFSPNSYSGGGQSGILDQSGNMWIATTVEGDIYFNFSYTV